MNIRLKTPEETIRLHFEPDGALVPNSRFPLIVYRQALAIERFDEETIEDDVDSLTRPNGWDIRWLWSIYEFTHYHPNCHEALACVSGEATVEFGGEKVGTRLTTTAGDAVIIPAGVGHKRIASSKDFHVVGAYPIGMEYWIWKSPEQYAEGLRLSKDVELPASDPFFGTSSEGITTLWK